MGVLLLASAAGLLVGDATPEGKALAFLSREVPAWASENKCYSCHNNGDAARALIDAVQRGRSVPSAALADTLDWLRRPADWDRANGDSPFKDRDLAVLQFASALTAATDAGLVRERTPLDRAAVLVASLQRKDGSWKPEGDEVGSPATYGTALATHSARRVLMRADSDKYRDPLRRSEDWLTALPVRSVIDAAAVLLGLEGVTGDAAERQRGRCLEVIRKGRGSDGGWGPYVTSPSEPFDTALVMLALRTMKDRDGVADMLRGGRRYLIKHQNAEGHWTETTRPAGAVSYAQRLSTAGWATQALLATSE